MEANIISENLENVLSSAFLEYAGYNLQRRAIPDARDGLKWGARQIIHAQMLGKFTYDKPFKKAIKTVAYAMGFSYIHGDASAYGTLIRMAKPFSYRVPLQEARGNVGTLVASDNHSQSRYVELRGTEACACLLKDLDKDTITEWEDTYDMEGQFPKVLPAKGFWGGVNGCISIGSGMSCSMPPLNLRETNETLIKLLWNPNLPDNELIVYPDFPTGAIILNQKEVFESLKQGYGKACKVRANIEWDEKEKCLIVKQLPYSTFTNTICNELATLIDSDENCPVREFVDYTKIQPDLRIYPIKSVPINKVINYLYKNTSLLTYYTINMVALDKGTIPKIMGQRELFTAYLTHEKEVYTRGYQFDLAKIQKRLHIIEGLLKAISMIEEVIRTIKGSSSTAEANMALCKLLNIDSEQAKAILDIKLSRLAHLEIAKLTNEQANLKVEETKINEILSNETLLKKEIEKGLREVAEKFGDDRRTKILNVETEEGQTTDEKLYQVSMTNQNNLIITETSSLYTQKRGGVGTKTKLDKGEFVKFSKVCSNNDMLLFFTANGKCVKFQMNSLEFSVLDKKTPIAMLCKVEDNDDFTTFVPINFKDKQNEFILFITKNGLIKKSELSEYNFNRGSSINAIKLDAGDKIVNVLFTSKLPIGILTKYGNFIIIDTKEINPIGRMTRGVIGIKLNADDEVVDSQLIEPDTKEFLFVSQGGRAVRNSKNDYTIQGRGGKGIRVRKLDNDFESKFVSLSNEQELIVASEKSTLKLEISTLPLMSRGALGVQTIKLKEREKISGISKF